MSSNRASYEAAREYRLGTLGFEQEVHGYLRELEQEGRVEKVRKSVPDGFVWHDEKGSRHSVQLWRLTKAERARLGRTGVSPAEPGSGAESGPKKGKRRI